MTIEELRALIDKATPGPWIADDFCEENDEATRVGTYDGTPTYYHRTSTIAYCQTNFGDDLDEAGPEIGIVAAEANARLIALAPQLAAENISLHQEIQRLREALEPFAQAWSNPSVRPPEFVIVRELTNGDFERARAALSPTPEIGEP